MAERTTDEVAQVFSAAGDSVTVVNAEVAKSSLTVEEEDRLTRNVEHLETVKAYTKEDGTTSIWTSESFTAIDAAITAGNAKL